MGANTGRSHYKYITVKIDNANAAALQTLSSVNSVGGVSLDYPPLDLTAWSDAVTGVLLGIPTFETEIGGVFDTTDNAVLYGINGGNVPLSFDVKFGIRQGYQEGEPQFGITSTASNGVLVRNYTVDPSTMTWKASIVMAAGSAAPAWGTASET